MKTTTVEERLTRIEHEFDELKHEILGLKPRAKTWRQMRGMIHDDELSRSAEKLGREWREQANKDQPIKFDFLKSLRQQVGTWDLKIACICLAQDATLLTRNLADFNPVPGLRVENRLD